MFNTVGKYIRRSPYQAIVATVIMSFTFYMISTFAIRTFVSMKLINYFESRPELTIFFQDEATPDDITTLRHKLEATGKVTQITYVSKEQALQIYRQQNKSDPVLLDLVTPDILPASLEVKAENPMDLAGLAGIAKATPNVEEVVFQKDIVDTLVSWINAFKEVGVAEILVLVVESILVIITIISFKIVIKKEEIETMKLIGATNSFIRIPFILEGVIYCIAGAVIGWFISVMVIVTSAPHLESFLKGIPIFPIQPILLFGLLGGEVLAACLLGAFASFVAVKRYLK